MASDAVSTLTLENVMSQKLPLTEANAERLLDLLCADDAFRTEFATDPCTAMAAHALLPLTVARDCFLTGELASKEEFLALREQIQAAISSRAVFRVPHYFENGQIENCLAEYATARAA